MRRLIAALLLFACVSSPSWADTNVCGTISGQTWTPAGSPYLVTCSVTVNSLTIQPGVSVIFLGNYAFEVNGGLSAVGTAQDSIYFTRPDSVSDWPGIHFNNPGYSSELAYCVISRATRHGIWIDNCLPVIHDCAIRLNTCPTGGRSFGAGIYANSPLTLRHCTINDNAVSATDYPWLATGGGIRSSSTLQLFDCRIVRNSAIAYGTSSVYSIHAYGGGVFADSATVTMERCVVDSNTARITGATGPSYDYQGAAIFSNSALGVCNTEIARNQACAAVSVGASGAVLVNCTIAHNSGSSQKSVGS